MAAMFADYQPDAHADPLPVEIRALTDADIDECAALAAERNGLDRATWSRAFRDHLTLDRHQTFVAVHTGRVVGYATVAWMTPSRELGGFNAPDGWYLTGLVVDPNWRRRGVGLGLTETRLEWLASRTHDVWYFANTVNRASLDLHTRLGFHEVTSDFGIPGVQFSGGTGVLFLKHWE